jgi:hypothetical protein
MAIAQHFTFGFD